jgi:hypothetical protein
VGQRCGAWSVGPVVRSSVVTVRQGAEQCSSACNGDGGFLTRSDRDRREATVHTRPEARRRRRLHKKYKIIYVAVYGRCAKVKVTKCHPGLVGGCETTKASCLSIAIGGYFIHWKFDRSEMSFSGGGICRFFYVHDCSALWSDVSCC